MSSADAAALQGTSLSAFVVTLLTNSIVSAVFLAVFLVGRTRFKRIYEPRAYVSTVERERRMRPLPTLGWPRVIWDIFREKEVIIEKSGMESYFFIRYLRFVLIVFIPTLLLFWPILLPINYAGGIGDNPPPGLDQVKGLDRFTFGNVPRQHTGRFWAHLILAWLFVIWFCYNVQVEMRHFVETRQQWLTSKKHRADPSATTILVNSLPRGKVSEEAVRELYAPLPGGVRNVWINRDYSALLDDVKLRMQIAKKLESAQTNLMRQAADNVANEKKKRDAGKEVPAYDPGYTDDAQANEVAYKYVSRKNRPQHRLPAASWLFSLPNWLFIGKKVDTIDWCKDELERLDEKIDAARKSPDQFKKGNSAFVQFNRQIAAHMAVQSVASAVQTHYQPLYLELRARDVVWGNMQRLWWERELFAIAVWAAVVVFTIFFAIPVAFIGSLSNITSLIRVAPFLRFLENLDPKYQGIITGLIPTILMAVILALVPVVMKLGARLQGHPTHAVISLVVQKMYFFFLFVQLFLVITISSGITSFISAAIDSPTKVPQLLATSLPKAATFYFSYFMLQGLSIAAGDLAQIVRYITLYGLGLLDSTPRQKWRRANRLNSTNWGTTFPRFTVLACIGIIYSVIAPLILIFVVIAFALLALDFLYNVMYVMDFDTDTGGLAFPNAINQTFVGIYFLELCLTGLFFLVRDAQGNGVPCKGQAIMMIILLVFTIIYHVNLFNSFHKPTHYLPLDSADEHRSQSPAGEERHRVEQKLEQDADGDADDEQAATEHRAGSALPAGSQGGDLEAGRRHRLGRGHFGADDSPRSDLSRFDADDDIAATGAPPSSSNAGARMPGSAGSEIYTDAYVRRSFLHEALRRNEPVVWLAQDQLGIAQDEVASLRKRGLRGFVDGRVAYIDDKNKVSVNVLVDQNEGGSGSGSGGDGVGIGGEHGSGSGSGSGKHGKSTAAAESGAGGEEGEEAKWPTGALIFPPDYQPEFPK